MTWQDAGVILVVGGAVYYLAHKFFGRPKRKVTTTFVPLKSLKK